MRSMSVTLANSQLILSVLHDTDYASETAQLTKAQIMLDAGTAMLAQANTLPKVVLDLLRH